MRSNHILSSDQTCQPSVEVIDLLKCQPSSLSFLERVRNLCLSSTLEKKINQISLNTSDGKDRHLLERDEKELATEVLMLRYRFTELVWQTERFNQAALSVIQNIYLFKNRKIFFDPCGPEYEKERQEALYLFSNRSESSSLPFSRTFQHLIIARVWNRILQCEDQSRANDPAMQELLEVVEKLNTIRNIYVLMTTGLVKKIVSQLGEIYKEGVTPDDACQMGSFGVARAAYRYHHSSGVRFSTYASNWIKKEVQRQALNSRLIRISTNSVEQYSKACQSQDAKDIEKYRELILNSSCQREEFSTAETTFTNVERISPQESYWEHDERRLKVLQTVESCLKGKEKDIILRRYGLAQYSGSPQSVISISELYGVTRSSIYQLEKKALQTLRRALLKQELCYS